MADGGSDPESRKGPGSLAAARALIDAGRYRESYDLALDMLSREEATAVDSPATADILDLMTEASWREGMPRPGLLDSAERSVRIRESAGDAETARLATSLVNLCAAQRLLGDPAAACPTCERSVAVSERALGPADPEVASGMNALALVLIDLADYAGARRVCGRALAIREGSQDRDPLAVAESLTTLGAILRWTSGFAAARRAYERALAIREAELPTDHPLLAQAINNLGVIRYQTSDLKEAREWIERALAMRRRILGPDHPETAVSLYSQAAVLMEEGDLPAARSAAEAGLRIRERVFGDDHKATVSMRLLLGRVLEGQRDLPAAGALLARALESAERTMGPDHPRVADILVEMSLVAGWNGDLTLAGQLGERALAIREKAFGPGDPKVAAVALFLVGSAWDGGRYDLALGRSLQAARIATEHARELARGVSEREALRYVDTWRTALDHAISAIAEPGLPRVPEDATSRVWHEVVRSRALVLDEMAARHRSALDVSDGETTVLLGRLDDARTRLSSLTASGPDAATPGGFSDKVLLARGDEERAERALADRIAPDRDRELQREVGLVQVAAALPADAALLAYVHYQRVLPVRTPPPGVPSYLAFVLRAGGTASAVPLGAAEEVEARVRRWREEVSSAPQDEAAAQCYRSAGERLRETIWDPIASRLAGAREVFIVPEGIINLVNLATLPAEGERYLLEGGRTLHYLSAERDLVRLSTSARHASSDGGILVFGGPDYDAPPLGPPGSVLASSAPSVSRPGSAGGAAGGAHTPYRGPTPGCATLRQRTFAPLPGAVAEAHEIRDLWARQSPAGRGGRGEFKELVGREADESTFKSLAPGYRILHVATHGFFADDACAESPGGPAPADGSAQQAEQRIVEDNPLLFSGLVFTGANKREDPAARRGLDDGMLTAEEIASLDLRGVDWAVLSACGTGIGPVETGEGVMGVRRTFQIAGARSVIMSLWAVDDHAAREWVRRLYEARLAGSSTTEAVRDAGLALLAARRQAGVTTHPFFWGAFVAAGDWR